VKPQSPEKVAGTAGDRTIRWTYTRYLEKRCGAPSIWRVAAYEQQTSEEIERNRGVPVHRFPFIKCIEGLPASSRSR